jgi:hypothetical protein
MEALARQSRFPFTLSSSPTFQDRLISTLQLTDQKHDLIQTHTREGHTRAGSFTSKGWVLAWASLSLHPPAVPPCCVSLSSPTRFPFQPHYLLFSIAFKPHYFLFSMAFHCIVSSCICCCSLSVSDTPPAPLSLAAKGIATAAAA